MKILLDMNLSPSWIKILETGGIVSKHWSQIGPSDAPDIEIMQWASGNGYTVFTHDLDYGALLHATQAKTPSVVQLRIEDVRPASVGDLVLQVLHDVEKQMEQGALITIDAKKNRIHLLPLGSNSA